MSGVPGSCPWGSLSPEQQKYFGLLKDVSEQEDRFVQNALGLMDLLGITGVTRPNRGTPRLLHTEMFGIGRKAIPSYVPLPPNGDAFAGVVVQARRFRDEPLPDGQVGVRIVGVGKETAQLVMVDRPLPISEVDIPNEQGLKAQRGVVIDRGRAADFVSGVLDQIRAQVTSR